MAWAAEAFGWRACMWGLAAIMLVATLAILALVVVQLGLTGSGVGDATAAIASLGYAGRQGEHMVALANTPQQHHLVVCTLCSCYPWPILGLPPVWYKSAPYRSRAVQDPRGVLRDFGVTLPAGTTIRVWDSTAEVRYVVIPMRPAGTEHLDAAALARLVTRDAMIVSSSAPAMSTAPLRTATPESAAASRVVAARSGATPAAG